MPMLTGRQRFIHAVEGKPVDRPPVWFMRQAGRYLPEYRALRKEHSFTEMYKSPTLATEVTLQPIRRFGFDAAILFSDILVVPEAMGLEIDFPEGGPVVARPVRTASDLARLVRPDPAEKLGFVREAIVRLRESLGDETALIGFSGAPWTLASYAVDGRGSKEFLETKALQWADPELLEQLLDRMTDVVIDYLVMQVKAGVDAVQLFDSWGGHLSPEAWRRLALPRAKRILDAVRAAGGRSIHFVLGAGEFLPDVASAGADMTGVDWHTPLSRAISTLGPACRVQGNLEPFALMGPPEIAAAEARKVLVQGRAAAGHVFNVGHGVSPRTRLESVQAVLDVIRAGA